MNMYYIYSYIICIYNIIYSGEKATPLSKKYFPRIFPYDVLHSLITIKYLFTEVYFLQCQNQSFKSLLINHMGGKL